ncbi:MAG: cyclic nucleotide-binding domain-containing protein, partial [bacterium]|nr:cyclic nucleotide-binding domain-containing protein [bacterium]
KKIELQPKEVLFEANTLGNEFFIIERGRIKIFKKVDDQNIVFAELGPGSCFGEMSLLDEYPRSASASAMEHCVLYSLSRDEFNSIVNTHDAVSSKLLLALVEIFTKRLRATDKHLETYHLVNKALITNEEFRELYKVIVTP